MNNCEDNINHATFDPGWNDPPSVCYEMQQSTTNRPRKFLNKRVAFPLSINSAQPVPAIPQPSLNLPPISRTLLSANHASVPAAKSNDNTQEEIENIDSEIMLKEVREVLLNLLNKYTELGSKSSDIRRRINIMEDMWTSGKLTYRIQIQMKDLVNALQNDQPKTADDIHRALMVDHVSSVSSWMLGIKQLIHHCIARSDLLAIDNE